MTKRDVWLKGAELIGIPLNLLKPHPAKAFFRKVHIPQWAIAKALGINEHQLRGYLSGRFNIPDSVEVGVQNLVKQVKGKVREKSGTKLKDKRRKSTRAPKLDPEVVVGEIGRVRGLRRMKKSDSDIENDPRLVMGKSWE